MNKLLLDKKEINILNDKNVIEIDVPDNDEFMINYFSDNDQDIDIKITMNNDSKLIFNIACLFKQNISVKINGIINGDNNDLKVNFRAIGVKEHSDVSVNIMVFEHTSNNKVLEDLKAINEEGTVSLMPILEIDSLDVDASHFATIGFLEKDKLFYLTSKGITYTNAYNMLKNKFLYALFEKEFTDKIIQRKEKNE